MRRSELLAHLSRLGACSDAHAWAEGAKGTPAQLWAQCPRGSWLLWLARVTGVLDRWTAADLACREFAPMALEAAAKRCPALAEWSAKLRAMAPVVDKATAETARTLCRVAHADAAGAAAYAALAACYAAAYAYRRALAEARKRTAEIVRKRITWAQIEAALITKEPSHG